MELVAFHLAYRVAYMVNVSKFNKHGKCHNLVAFLPPLMLYNVQKNNKKKKMFS